MVYIGIYWLLVLLTYLVLLLLILCLVVRDLLVALLFHEQLDGVTDELRVLLHDILEAEIDVMLVMWHTDFIFSAASS